MITCYVYGLFSKKHNRLYIGQTKDLDNRLREHNSGRVRSTKYYRPWVLFYNEKCNSRIEARNREKRLKTSFGRSYLKEILENASL